MTDRKGGPVGPARGTPVKPDFRAIETKVEDIKKSVRESKKFQPKKKVSKNKGTLDELQKSLNDKPKFSKMVEYSVECLKGLAVDEVSIEEMVEEGVLDTLLRVLKLNPYNENIQRMVNDTIKSFCINDKMAALVASKLAAAGGATLAHSMKKHVEPETLKSTASTTAKLLHAKDKEATEQFVRGGILGGIKHLIENSKDVQVVEHAIDSLEKISGSSPQHAVAVYESGVIEPTLNYWSEHIDEPKIAENSIGLISNLAKASPKMMESLKKAGAVDHLLASLDAHPDNEEIAKVGVEALKLFTNQSDVGAALVVSVGNNKATANAAAKLSSLLLVPENVDYMVKNNGIPWLVNALKGAVGQEGDIAHSILKAGTRAMGRMATGEGPIYAIMKEGGVKVLVSILNTHTDDDEVAASSLHALSKMLTRKPNADFILKSGGLEAALAVLQQNPDSEDVAQAFLEFIEGLAKYPEHVPSLLPHLPKVVDIINRHGHNPQIAALGMVAMGRMGISEEAMKAIIDSGGLKAGVAVLSQHAGNPKAAKPAAMLLETATMLPITLEPLRALGAVKALANSMAAIDDPELHEVGEKTIAAVAGKKDLADAFSDLKKFLPRDPAKADAKETAKLVPPAVIISSLTGDSAKGGEYQEYTIKNGGIPALMKVFDAAREMPPSDPSKKKLLRETAQALLNVAPNKEAQQQMAKEKFGKTLNDEAEKSGDPELQKIAEEFQKVTGGAAGGGDPDAERERNLKEALDAISSLPTDPSKPDSKYPSKYSEPLRTINNALDDDAKGDKNAEFLGDNGAVKKLIDLFNNLAKLPPGDPLKKRLLKDTAEALLKLSPTDGALDEMNKKRFGEALRNEANATGDPELKRLADEFAKMPGGAGGADEDYSDPNDKKAMLRALKELSDLPKDASKDPRFPQRLVNPGAFLNKSADNPDNRDFLGNNGAVKKLIDAWEALSKLPPGDPNRKKGLRNIAEALLKMAPDDQSGELIKRRFGKMVADEAARSADPELKALAEKLKQALGEDPEYGSPSDKKELARALADLEQAAKDSKNPRAPGKVVIPAAFLNNAADDPKAREYLGGNVKKLIDAFEALSKLPPGEDRKKGLKNIAELLKKLAQEPGPAKEIAARKFGQMLKDEAMHSNDPELKALASDFAKMGLGGEDGGSFKGSASVSPTKAPPALKSASVPAFKETRVADPKQFYEVAGKPGGMKALADMLNKAKGDPSIFPAAAQAFADMLDKMPDEELARFLDDPACVEALMNLIKANETLATPLSLSDLAKATGAAAKLKLKPATAKQMLKNNPLGALTKMVAHSDDPLLLANAAKLLGRLAGHDEAMAMLSQIASIRELIDAMRRNIKNQEFLRYGCFLLGEFAENEALKSEIGIEGGIGLILQITGLYPKNKDLIENCCYALAKCSYNHPVNSTFVVASNGIKVLIGLLSTYPKAEELLENAVCALCNICFENNRNKDAIVASGGAQAIVDTVLNNFDAVDLMVTCLRTLGQLAYNKPNSEAIIKAGGVQGIVASMTVHAEKEDVILMAIRVLTNLAADAADESMQVMAQDGAVQAVVEAAINYLKYPEIELAALGCLCNLGLAKYNASMIIKQGGTEAICDAFTHHSYEAKITEKGSRLCHILTHSPPDLDRMIEGKASDGLLGAMKAHGKSRPILSPALNAIAALSYGEKSAAKLNKMTPGLIPACMTVLKVNMSDPQIVIDSFKALAQLSRHKDNAVGMADMTLKSLIEALKTHAMNPKVLEFAFKFLGNLCVHKECPELVPPTGAVPAVLTSLAMHKTDPATLIHGCKALENIAYGSVPVREYMKKEGTIQAMKQIQTDNPTRDDVKRAAQAVIDALNRTDSNYDFTPMSLMPAMDKKKAKEIFGKDEKGPVTQLPKEIRNLLNAGALMIKHSKTAQPRKKHFYVDMELKFLVWRDPKEKQINPKNKMKVGWMKQVEKGLCTPQLQRKTLMGKKDMAKEDCAFAVIGRDRTIDLECSSNEERDKWANALEILMEYKRALKLAHTQFGNR